jgi:RHS repeat-associated protein
MLTMEHLSRMLWDYNDRLTAAIATTSGSYYNYDAEGNRTRKVVVKGNIREERYYIGGYEVYRKYVNGTPDTERKTVNISDDEKVFVRVETATGQSAIVRYQYDNHLGSACLELDTAGLIISYEEYHPFGTTSYRAGRSQTEVSLKRYKYCGKERDEETGLYYYGARYYAAWLCRFVTVDPLQHKYPNLSPYAYCANNPVNLIDPTGMSQEEPSKGTKQHETTSCEVCDAAQKKITIDPGHGDQHDAIKIVDPGSVSGTDYEKDIAIEISNSVNQFLTDSGYTVTMTRTGDKEDAGKKLKWRIDAAEGTDIFVSIHINASKEEVAKGFEVLYKKGDTESKSLAQSIQNENTLFLDRGIKERNNLYVLNEFKGVAVLVEAGFISNASDLETMKTNAEQIGREIATGIMNYFKK